MSNNPAAVFHRGMELLLAKDMAGFIALFGKDAVLELPFAPPGQPRRVAGYAELHEYLIITPPCSTCARSAIEPCTRPGIPRSSSSSLSPPVSSSPRVGRTSCATSPF
ncbi:hypothetical protein NKG94_19970 [Micromonospora sp. M12]